MQARGFVYEAILQVDRDCFANCCLDSWERPLVVDTYDRSVQKSIGVSVDPCEFPIVSHRECT